MLNEIWPAKLLVNKHHQAEHTLHQYCSPQLKLIVSGFYTPKAVVTGNKHIEHHSR